ACRPSGLWPVLRGGSAEPGALPPRRPPHSLASSLASPRSPCAAVPSRVVLAFVPGIALQAPAAAATGPRSGAGPRPVLPAQPLPCPFGRCPVLQPHAGWAPLHTGHTTHSRPPVAAAAGAWSAIPGTKASTTREGTAAQGDRGDASELASEWGGRRGGRAPGSADPPRSTGHRPEGLQA
uniref:Uncharacterized protein n=1 Tax=Urocitellus parryii TaxID=9999 RepID=A0A8D2IGG1_UROPR